MLKLGGGHLYACIRFHKFYSLSPGLKMSMMTCQALSGLNQLVQRTLTPIEAYRIYRIIEL